MGVSEQSGWWPVTLNGPNTSLHRTPAAAPPSPVSFQTFGPSGRTALLRRRLMRSHRKYVFVLYLVAICCARGPSSHPSRGSQASTDVRQAFTATADEVRVAVIAALKSLGIATGNPTVEPTRISVRLSNPQGDWVLTPRSGVLATTGRLQVSMEQWTGAGVVWVALRATFVCQAAQAPLQTRPFPDTARDLSDNSPPTCNTSQRLERMILRAVEQRLSRP